MARFLVLALCGFLLTACSVASAQGSLEPTQTAIARQAIELEQTRTALDIAVVQTQQQARMATSTALAQTAVVNKAATLQSQLATATSLAQTRAVEKIAITQTALANQHATIQARLTATPRPAVEPLSLTPGGLNPVIPLLYPLYVFVRGDDGLLYYKVYKNGAWADWQSLQPPPVGITMDSPSVVAQGDSRIDLFVRGQDGALWHAVSDGVSWTTWESLGGQLTSGPSAVIGR